ncbi:hypothetical protein [Flavobacterium sp.]|uniref:hypothetical protein n=1 Tax=Flavobacterium sp. TaxID=239 RepID=UPI002B4B0527|nr:hypothetical protein [Flavobacterium sp.]HLF51516.1 hypothetical protein [Flavobacterium sp.]
MAKWKNPDELETFIDNLEKSNKVLSDEVTQLKKELKKLQAMKKSDFEQWFYGEKNENDEDEKE